MPGSARAIASPAMAATSHPLAQLSSSALHSAHTRLLARLPCPPTTPTATSHLSSAAQPCQSGAARLTVALSPSLGMSVRRFLMRSVCPGSMSTSSLLTISASMILASMSAKLCPMHE